MSNNVFLRSIYRLAYPQHVDIASQSSIQYYLDGNWKLSKVYYPYYGYLLWTMSFTSSSLTSPFIFYEI